MRSMEVTDEWLYQHMPVVDNAMITALENQVDREYVFSKRFEQKNAKSDPPGSPSGADRCTTAPKTHCNLFHRYRMWRTGSDVKCGCLSG